MLREAKSLYKVFSGEDQRFLCTFREKEAVKVPATSNGFQQGSYIWHVLQYHVKAGRSCEAHKFFDKRSAPGSILYRICLFQVNSCCEILNQIFTVFLVDILV
jgi:hypothetical protein